MPSFLLIMLKEREPRNNSSRCAKRTQSKFSLRSFNVRSFDLVMTQKQSYVELGALLIQKKITTVKTNIQQLNEEDVKQLIGVCMNLIENPQMSLNSLKRVAEILIHLIRTVGNENYNEEFFSMISNYAKNERKTIKLFMLYTLETFAEFTFNNELLVNNADRFVEYFSTYLQDADPEVKTEAASAFTNFLSMIEDEKFIIKFQSAFPMMIDILIEAVRSNQERGLKMVNALDGLARSHTKFVKDHIERLLDVFTEMAGERSLSSGLRNAAILGIVGICTKHALTVKKSSVFCNKTIAVLMNIITEQPDNLTEWLASEDAHELSSNNVHAAAVEAFSGLNEGIGSKFMLQKTIGLAFKFISSDNWKEKYAGLMSLAMLFEGSKKHFEDELENFIKLLIPTLQFGNAKVLYASMTCIALLTTEFSPDLQIDHHASILPPVIHILQSAPEIKLRIRAVSMLINFFRELLECDEEEKEFTSQYINPIMDSLIQLFEQAVSLNQMSLLEEVVSLISILAALTEDKFAPFYSKMMPGLKNLVFSTPNDTDSNNKLRTLSISTLGYVVASHSLNPQEIEGDIIQIMEYLVGLQGTLTPEDSQHKAILEVYEVLVGSLKEKFLPFLEPVIKQTLECANRDIKFVVEDHLGGEVNKKGKAEKGDHAMLVDLKILGGQKVISINHSSLEQKLIAFDMMRQLAKVLKKHLRPYLETLSKIIYENLDYKFSSGIRDFCYRSLKHLMGVCSTEAECQDLFQLFAPKLIKLAEDFLRIENDEKSHNILKHLLESAEQLKTSVIRDDIIQQWFNALKTALVVSKKRKEEVIAEFGNVSKLDEEERDDFETEFAQPNLLMHIVMNTSSWLLKMYKSKYEKTIVDELGYYFYSKSKEWVVEDEMHYAVCFYAELFNNCSQSYIDQGYGIVLETCLPTIAQTEDINFQQTGAFLIGVLAKKCTREQFSKYLDNSLAVLSKFLSEPDAKSEDKKVRTDTVVGAFGKLCMYQFNPADPKCQERTYNFVSTLPLQVDPEEAQYINKLFLKELGRKNQNLLATDALQSASKEAVLRMNGVATNNPELEILNDDGLRILKEIIG